MDLLNLDVVLVDTEARREIRKIRRGLSPSESSRDLRLRIETIITLENIREEITRCQSQVKRFFDSSVLMNSHLHANKFISSEVLKQLSWECQRDLLLRHGNLRSSSYDMGEYASHS